MHDSKGQEVAAVRGVLTSILGMIEKGATHLGVATDHVIESFRNKLWADYKTGEGVEPELLAQFPLLEEALSALGVVVWPMVEFEADDALAAAAFAAEKDPAVDRVLICTPDKDLSPVRPRNPSRPARPSQEHHSRRGRRDCEVRRRAGVDSRLPGTRRRRCGRISRISRLGSEVCEQGPCTLPPYRIDPRKLARLGRRCCEPFRIIEDASSRPRTCPSVSRLSDLAHRDTPLSIC